MTNLELRRLFYNFICVIVIALISCNFFSKYGDYSLLLMISIAWVLITTVVFLLVKTRIISLIYSFFNAFMAGMAMAVYFLKADNFEIIQPQTVFILIILIGVNYILFTLSLNTEKISKWMLLLWLGMIVGGLYLWGLRGLVQASWLVFISIIGFMLNIAIVKFSSDGRKIDIYKVISLYSMLEFGGIFFLVITIISEGDTLDLLNGAEPELRKKRKI